MHDKYLLPYTIVFGKESVHARSAILRGRGRKEIRLAAAYKQKLLPVQVELERDCSVQLFSVVWKRLCSSASGIAS